jgi:DNA polymerase/3'-5' exonuclease PolX
MESNNDATTPVTKRARTSSATTPTAATPSKNASAISKANTPPPSTNKRKSAGILKGYTIIVLPNVGIKHLPTRLKAWAPGVTKLGGTLLQTYPPPSPPLPENNDKSLDITHILVGPGGIANLPPELKELAHPGASDSDEDLAVRDHAPFVVDHSWLEQTLLHGVAQAEGQHRPKPAPQSSSSSVSVVVPGGEEQNTSRRKNLPSAREVKDRKLWLGEYFHDACAAMTLNELVLQNVYNIERSIQLGNEPIALQQLGNYERASQTDYFEDLDKPGGEAMNHRALRYFRAAAVVRGCAFSLKEQHLSAIAAREKRALYLGSEEREVELEDEDDDADVHLPFVGEATKAQIHSIIEIGTCATLEAFRNNQHVTDSRGKRRIDTIGGATRYLFFKLPGVGQKTARLWWDLGLRSYEDVLEAAKEGQALSPLGPNKLTIDQKFSLEHRHDLLADTTEEEVESMLNMVKDALKKVSHPSGWRVELVGGGRRGSASHDADYLVTHPTLPIENVVLALKDHLIANKQLFPPSEAMCKVQNGLLPTHIEKLKEEYRKHHSTGGMTHQTLDRFDHIYGNTRVPATGRVSRIDVIICPPEEWASGFLGWVGSRTFLRMQRNFVNLELGMFLNSHGLFLKGVGGEQGDAFLVPQERPPKLRSGESGWPPGWSAERKVETEEDIFELLGTPYRPPCDRNCF